MTCVLILILKYRRNKCFEYDRGQNGGILFSWRCWNIFKYRPRPQVSCTESKNTPILSLHTSSVLKSVWERTASEWLDGAGRNLPSSLSSESGKTQSCDHNNINKHSWELAMWEILREFLLTLNNVHQIPVRSLSRNSLHPWYPSALGIPRFPLREENFPRGDGASYSQSLTWMGLG